MTVLATAGHVDAGKSTLVLGLTGTDPDRLPEERSRGLTVDLGFAALRIGDATISFVDVPGHVRYLRNMLAGAGAVQGAVLVVAADDGWRAQTQEHVDILRLLGVEHLLVVISKTDRVDHDRLDDIRRTAAGRLDESGFPDAAITGADLRDPGQLASIRVAIEDLARTIPPPSDIDRPRLWVDRSFTRPGAGPVVTGVLSTGSLSVGDDVVIGPADRPARIRAIQSHHTSRDSIGPGHRVALNLAGVSHRQVRRGDVVVRPRQWHVTTVIDASLSVLSSAERGVGRRGAFTVHLGTMETAAAVRVLAGERIAAGESGIVRLRLAQPVLATPGDRFVLRDSGRDQTIGGGEILDVDPVLPTSRARPDRSIERVVAERGSVPLDVLAQLVGPIPTDAVAVLAHRAVAPGHVETIRHALLDRIRPPSGSPLDPSSIDELERAILADCDEVVVRGGQFVWAAGPDGDDVVLARLSRTALSPPALDGAERAAVRRLASSGQVVRIGDHYFATAALDDAIRRVHDALDAGVGAPSTAAELRDALGTSRKFAIPLLEWMDGTGRTRRDEDGRVPGPRSGQPVGRDDLTH